MEQLPVLRGLTWPMRRINRGFATIKHTSVSGHRTRTAQRSLPVYSWELTYDIITAGGVGTVISPFSDGAHFSDGGGFATTLVNDYDTIRGFYNRCLGSTLPFLYCDSQDSVAIDQTLGLGDGVTTQFRLVRSIGGFYEPVNEIDENSLEITVGGTPVEDSRITYVSPGVIELETPPPILYRIAWSGTYMWRVRFDADELEFEQYDSLRHSLQKLSFSSEIL